MNLSDAIDQYLTLRAVKKSAGTVRCETSELKMFLAYTGNIRVAGLTAQRVQDYFYGPQGRHQQVQASSFNNTRARLLGFLKWCQDEGLVKTNLMRNIDRSKVYAKDRQRLTPQQMADMIEKVVHPRDRIAIALACNTGIRASSVEGLLVKDIDLNAGTIRYVNVKLRRERVLPITADLDRELRRWFVAYAELCGPLEQDWYLVPARPRGGWHDEVIPTKPAGRIVRIAHAALAGIGVDEKGEGMHTFRRSAGRAVFETAIADGDPRAIYLTQAFLDHADPAQTMVYVGTNLEQQKLNDMLRGKDFLTTTVDNGAESNVIQVQFGRRNA